MTQTFEAGETYKTPSGRDAHIVARVEHWLIGFIWSEGGLPTPRRWGLTGCCEDANLMLLPPKRQIWVAVWMRRDSGLIETLDRETEEQAEECCRFTHRRRIAVAGPFDVEAEP